MISTLVQSALQTGYLSVESEGLIRQVITLRTCTKPDDLAALRLLYDALQQGQILREAQNTSQLPVLR